MASNEARKTAAKLYQEQHPGTPYPEALRIVSRLTGNHPLTALIGSDKHKAVHVNLDEPGNGGCGPHIGVYGPVGSGRTTLLTVMAQSILQKPPPHGAEVMLCSRLPRASAAWRDERIIKVEDHEVEERLSALLAQRSDAHRRRETGSGSRVANRATAEMVVMLDDYQAVIDRGLPWPRAFRETLQIGCALGIHLVLGWHTDTMPKAEAVPPELARHLGSYVELLAPGHGRWHRGCTPPVSTDITVPLAP